MEARFELLRRLSRSARGCEYEVKEIIEAELAGLCDELTPIAQQPLQPPAKDGRIMLSAHTDEVGFMITHIDDDGTLKFDAVGIDARALRSPRRGRQRQNGAAEHPVHGIIGAKPIHLRRVTKGRAQTKWRTFTSTSERQTKPMPKPFRPAITAH